MRDKSLNVNCLNMMIVQNVGQIGENGCLNFNKKIQLGFCQNAENGGLIARNGAWKGVWRGRKK